MTNKKHIMLNETVWFLTIIFAYINGDSELAFVALIIMNIYVAAYLIITEKETERQ